MKLRIIAATLLLMLALLVTSCGETPSSPTPTPPSTPVLSSPADNATGLSTTPRLEWQQVEEATTYSLQLSTSPDFSPSAINETAITNPYYDISPELGYETTYYWRVKAANADGTSDWSSQRSFITEAAPPPPPPSEVIRLYYWGFTGLEGMGQGLHNIYSASSNDGINFTEDPGVRFSYDTEGAFGPGLGITDPDVVSLNDGSWLMFLSVGTHLLKATSPTSDGTFALDESFSWNRGGVPDAYNFDGTVMTFVCYQGGINVATYDQETGTLTNSGVALNAPTSGMIADPSVIKVDDQYLMFYKYATSESALPDEHEIYLATSSDGVTWTQHNQNRFIGMGSVPGAVYYNGVIYVYYCGQMHTPDAPFLYAGDLGLAISEDQGATFSFSTIMIQGKTDTDTVDPAAIVTSD